MVTKIHKWGNSLGIRIPTNIVKDLSLKNGSLIDLEKEADKIIIRPRKMEELYDLLNLISDENLHSEIDFGESEGDEIW